MNCINNYLKGVRERSLDVIPVQVMEFLTGVPKWTLLNILKLLIWILIVILLIAISEILVVSSILAAIEYVIRRVLHVITYILIGWRVKVTFEKTLCKRFYEWISPIFYAPIEILSGLEYRLSNKSDVPTESVELMERKKCCLNCRYFLEDGLSTEGDCYCSCQNEKSEFHNARMEITDVCKHFKSY